MHIDSTEGAGTIVTFTGRFASALSADVRRIHDGSFGDPSPFEGS